MISGSVRSSSSRQGSAYGDVPSENAYRGAVALRGQPALRTLDDVRLQVAHEVALRAITKSEILDGVRVGVSITLSKSEDEMFVNQVADVIRHQLALGDYLFAIATTGTSSSGKPNPVVICGSEEEFIQRAILLTSSKFIGRVKGGFSQEGRWSGLIEEIGVSTYDDDALWDVVRKSARTPIDPTVPPPGSRGIDQILLDARAQLQRITPRQAYDELREPQVGAPTFLVDIRPVAQRDQGGIHGSLIIERNVLEWRFDPRSTPRLPIADRYDLRVIVFCQEGYTSSLAAFALQQLGLLNATDVIGGYQAWKDAGLPVDGKGKPRSLLSLEGSIV
ncbi:Rhodanese-like domain-containing protein [Lyophyllum atratum]|nr:Rhodanese-like domain-containing protein [Lyophyllum atratum]